MISISHSRDDETPEAKTRWFQSLTVEERADWLCEFTDLVLEINPKIMEQKMLNRLKDVFSSFQKHNVRYVVIGGIAAILYGVPRATFDLDVFFDRGYARECPKPAERAGRCAAWNSQSDDSAGSACQ